MHAADVIQGGGPGILFRRHAPQTVQFLLQQTGIAPGPLLPFFHKRTAGPAQIQVAAGPAGRVKAAGLMQFPDLARRRLHDAAHALFIYIAVIKIFLFLPAYTGENISVLLQKKEFLSAVDTVGAVIRPEFPEPGAFQPRFQFRSHEGVTDPTEKGQLFFLCQRVQKGAAVLKSDHEIEIQHVQTGVFMQIPDIRNDLIDPFQMFPENGSGNLFMTGDILQEGHIGQDTVQGIPAVFSDPAGPVQGQRQVDTAADRYLIPADCFQMTVQIQQVGLDMGPAGLEAGACQKIPVPLIIIGNISSQVPEGLRVQAGDFSSMQGYVKGYDIFLPAFIDGVSQCFQRAVLCPQIFGILFQIAVFAGHIAGHGRNIEQMYISIHRLNTG